MKPGAVEHQHAIFTACTIVQAVVQANSQSNGNGQISTPRNSETPERISMKLGIQNYVGGMTTHANSYGVQQISNFYPQIFSTEASFYILQQAND